MISALNIHFDIRFGFTVRERYMIDSATIENLTTTFELTIYQSLHQTLNNLFYFNFMESLSKAHLTALSGSSPISRDQALAHRQ